MPVFSKIFEKIMYQRLYNYFLKTKLLYDKQFGFRKNHSTSHAVNYSINKIIKDLESKKHVIGVFLDLSKAFDTIDHTKLLEKMEHYGIRGTCYDLLNSYLEKREQFVDFQGTHSEKLSIEYGVPQGSVLGPLLFLVYINDIVNCSSKGHFVLFADDTNIFISGNTEKEAYDNASVVLKQVENYMICNQLHINLSKSVYMHFRPTRWSSAARVRPYGSEFCLKLGNTPLNRVDKVKFLGVIIDDELSWEPQIQYVKEKLHASINIIKRIYKFIPKDEHINLYNSLFKSHLSYCLSSWGGAPAHKLDTLFAVQKRCVRLLFGKRFTFDHLGFYETCARIRTYQEHTSKRDYSLEHTKAIFNENKILSLQNLYSYHSTLEVLRIMKFRQPISLFELLEVGDRKSCLNLKIPKISKNKHMHEFSFSSAKIWNKIVGNLFDTNKPQNSGIVIPGSVPGSDVTIKLSIFKNRLHDSLFKMQKICVPGRELEWGPENHI